MEERRRDWVFLAGIALMLAGILRFFSALWAFVLPSKLEGVVFDHRIKA